jgi:hypothetical protein
MAPEKKDSKTLARERTKEKRVRNAARKAATEERKRLIAEIAPRLYCAEPVVTTDDYYKGDVGDLPAADYQKRVNRLLTYFTPDTLKKLAAALVRYDESTN